MRCQLSRLLLAAAVATVPVAGEVGEVVTAPVVPVAEVGGQLEEVLRNPKRSHAMRVSKKTNTPLVVVLTDKHCAACSHLIASLNQDSTFRYLLPRFTAVLADTPKAWKAWRLPGHEYMPQTLFFPPGEKDPLPIHGTNDEAPHFLHDAATVAWGMETCLTAVTTGDR